MRNQDLQEVKSLISGLQVKVPDDCADSGCMWAGHGPATAPCMVLIPPGIFGRCFTVCSLMQLVLHGILKSTLKDYEDKNMGYNKYLLFASMLGGGGG